MYTETQYFQNRFTQLLKWVSAGLAVLQLTALAGAEMGLPWAIWGQTVHLILLLSAAFVFALLASIGLDLRVSRQGWDVRFFPYNLRYRHLGWDEIKNARLLPIGTKLPGAVFGLPAHRGNRFYLLTNPAYAVFQLELISGGHWYITTQNPEELLDFLRHALVQPETKVGSMVL